MKLRSVLVALIVCIAVTAAFATRARASANAASCGLWDYCFCLEIDCSLGDQLCATGPGFSCYQPGWRLQ